jgi:DNA-binding CsgD family transcriptional regulator
MRRRDRGIYEGCLAYVPRRRCIVVFTEKESRLIQERLRAGQAERDDSPSAADDQAIVLVRRETVRPGSALSGSRTISPRENQVLGLLVRGFSPREVAAQLGIDQKTVDSHRGRLLNKLNLRGGVQLAYWALQHGRITTGELEAVWSRPRLSALDLADDPVDTP